MVIIKMMRVALSEKKFTGEFGFSRLLLFFLFFPPQLCNLHLKLGFPRQEVLDGYHCALEQHLVNTQAFILPG